MPTFVESCNCKGVRPDGIIGTRHTMRPDITGMLLKERGAPRAIIAPSGYGKSSAAFEYAQVVFGFEHTFWLRGSSPCFLRDLDTDKLAQMIFDADDQVGLVVCDGIPTLGEDRINLFVDFADALSGHGCELIVTCTPSAGIVAQFMASKIIIDPYDIMLTHDELVIEEMQGAKPKGYASSLPVSHRIACMVWGDDKDRLMRGFRSEEMPSALRSLVLGMLVLERGTFADLSWIFSRVIPKEDIEYLSKAYPHLGIDIGRAAFSSIEASISDVARSLGRKSAGISMKTPRVLPEDACERIATLLFENNRAIRASEFLIELAERATCLEWLKLNGWNLIVEGEALAVFDLADAVRKTQNKASLDTDSINVLSAWASYLISDDKQVARMVNVLLRSESRMTRLCASVLLLSSKEASKSVTLQRAASRSEMPQSAASQVKTAQDAVSPDERWIHGMRLAMQDSPQNINAAFSSHAQLLDFEQICELILRFIEHDEKLIDALLEIIGKKDVDNPAKTQSDSAMILEGQHYEMPYVKGRPRNLALVYFCSWVLSHPLKADNRASRFSAADVAEVCSQYLLFVLSGNDALPKWLYLISVNALKEFSEDASVDACVLSDTKMLSKARKIDLYMREQMEAINRRRISEQDRKRAFELAHPDPYRANGLIDKDSADKRPTPDLHISLFGGLDVSIGNDDSQSRIFKRKKAKIVLAMLAVNRGREVSWERMVRMLWADAEQDFCRRNFYVVWSYLKHELEIDGTCPYLLKTQTGFRLNNQFLTTDIDRFDGLCKQLLFGSGSDAAWEESYMLLSKDFADDFLPEVTNNPFVDETRKHYRNQLIDALVSASMRLNKSGELRGALWFAREALRRDELREDSYIALMEAQIASGQRGAALDTYFMCMHNLSDKLGIDPSSSLVKLYNSIIATQEAF